MANDRAHVGNDGGRLGGEQAIEGGAGDSPAKREASGGAADSAIRRMASGPAREKALALIAAGERDANHITDEVFYELHHDLRDQKLAAGTPEAREWMALLVEVVRPALAEAPAREKAPTEKAPAKKAPAEKPPAETAPAEKPAEKAPADGGASTLQSPPKALAGADETHVGGGPAQGGAGASTVVGGVAVADVKTTKKEAEVLSDIRADRRRFDPKWLMAAQKALGVADASGAFNTETLRAIRAAKGATLDAKKILDVGLLQSIEPGEPFLVESAGNHRDEAPNPSANAPGDRVAQKMGYASYESWHRWVDIRLLGKKLNSDGSSGKGHPRLAERLAAADAFLRNLHPNQTDEEIRNAIGWNGQGNASYAEGADQVNVGAMHTMGLAIDIDPMRNPWIFRGSEHGRKDPAHRNEADYWYEEVSRKATKIFGGEMITAATMAAWSAEMSSEELHAKIAQVSSAWEQYMQLCAEKDDVIHDKLVAAGWKEDEVKPEIAKMRGYPAVFHSKERRQQEAKGLTNVSEELLVALRDAAGLSWGGTEMSPNQNGDFMHFDLRGDAFGSQVFAAIWDEHGRAAAAADADKKKSG